MNTTIIQGDRYRISILTDRLLRLEYQAEGYFEDLPTQMAVNRDFPEVDCRVERENGRLVIETAAVLLSYDERPFSTPGLSCTVKETGGVWNYCIPFGNCDKNLYGTARTLDGTDGVVDLEMGLFGESGYAVLDDGASPVFDGGNYRSRTREETDLYFCGFGKDYYGGLQEFYCLSGSVPMIPRYALGNWWSRFYRYTEQEYLDLLAQFEKEEVPLSVAVVDMDWHITEPDPRYGTGWTGYTWDPECFPDPERFLHALHERGLAVSLNLHPADGVRAFESMYPQVAQRVGIDPATEIPVEHDFEDESYRDAYFEEIIHPYEEMGVDFWWIDWQQGRGRTKDSVDPLLLLNYWHYHDQESRGKRAMLFSRYAGPGSHRYPIGFSGDTWTTWRSLDLQPYFTAVSSNIGYGWWSHDIGGHMHGDRDDERFVRWVQFGVFSPIMRLHSCGSAYVHREPWAYEEPCRQILDHFLRLRHRLVPYIYTAVREAHTTGRPLLCPMYYSCPEETQAYDVKNAYQFGPGLIVGAVTEPVDSCLRRAGVSMYIPEGRWVDIFTGQIYHGKVQRRLYRTLKSIPVLLAAGAILPEDARKIPDAGVNPDQLRVLFGAGMDGEYSLYEDDGRTNDCEKGAYASTGIIQRWMPGAGDNLWDCEITILPAQGDLSLIPSARRVELVLCGVRKTSGMQILPGGSAAPEAVNGQKDTQNPEPEWSARWEEETGFLSVDAGWARSDTGCRVLIKGIGLAENDAEKETRRIIDEAYIQVDLKEQIEEDLEEAADEESFLQTLAGRDIPEIVKDAIRENYTCI